MSDPRARRPTRPRAAAAALVLGLLALVPSGAVAAEGPHPVPGLQADDGPQLPVDPGADPARTRERADQILAGDEYQPPPDEAPGGRSLLDRIGDWFRDRLPDLELSGPGKGANNLVSVVIVAVVVLGSVALGVWVVAASRRRRLAPDDDEVDSDVEVTPLRTPSEWTTEAERCEAAGDHRGAVRARFRAVTTTLVRRDLVADSPGRTVGELREDLARRAPEARPTFDLLAAHFEQIWFGSATAGADDAERARTLAAAALEAAPRGPVALAGTDPEGGT